MMKVVELTKENEKDYLDGIAELENIVLEVMKKEGREGQLFATGKEDISEYVHSEENTVLVAIDDENQIEAATYVTQGQKAFTYNDITKYFKYGEKYKQHIKVQYQDEQQYKKEILLTYGIKIKAFEYARNRILSEHPEVEDLHQFLEQEVKQNGFHEKSELREKVNRYMSEYIECNFVREIQTKFEQFYWITADDISREFGKKIDKPNSDIQQYERFMSLQEEYEEILKKGQLTVYEDPNFDVKEYYSANTQNAVRLDTYITNPNNRSAGIARIIVFEGIKKHMEMHFKNPQNTEIFLCSTLHRDNLSSKYVSEFFGLTDSLYVNRRQGRDREVHICRIQREQAMEYLTAISNKLAVLYGYNPNQKYISKQVKKIVLKEQLRYEKKELDRLVKAKTTDKRFNGINVKFIESKLRKIQRLEQELVQSSPEIGGNSYGE